MPLYFFVAILQLHVKHGRGQARAEANETYLQAKHRATSHHLTASTDTLAVNRCNAVQRFAWRCRMTHLPNHQALFRLLSVPRAADVPDSNRALLWDFFRLFAIFQPCFEFQTLNGQRWLLVQLFHSSMDHMGQEPVSICCGDHVGSVSLFCTTCRHTLSSFSV